MRWKLFGLLSVCVVCCGIGCETGGATLPRSTAAVDLAFASLDESVAVEPVKLPLYQAAPRVGAMLANAKLEQLAVANDPPATSPEPAAEKPAAPEPPKSAPLKKPSKSNVFIPDERLIVPDEPQDFLSAESRYFDPLKPGTIWTMGERVRVIMYGDLKTCPSCRASHKWWCDLPAAEKGQLPIALEFQQDQRAYPEGVLSTPAFHWQRSDGQWVMVQGWRDGQTLIDQVLATRPERAKQTAANLPPQTDQGWGGCAGGSCAGSGWGAGGGCRRGRCR